VPICSCPRPALRTLPMRSRWLCLPSLIFLSPAFYLRAQVPPPAPSQTIRLTVERVNVGVIVTSSRGKFVERLRREDFRVFDNGAEEQITEFAPVDDPAQVLLLVEAGPAVYFLQDVDLYTASALLEGLSPGDRVAVARYTEAPLTLLDFTADKRAAQNALDGIRFNLGFGQLNLSASLNALLDWLARVPGKKTIVLLSTGVDTSSNAAIDLLQSRLQTGDVRILCVSLSAPLRNGKEGGRARVQQAQQGFADADARLQAIADATGGRVFFPENAKAFQETYRQIAQLVRHEYSLAFQPPAADGAVHRIKVTVNLVDESNKGKPLEYRVDHRRAYRAPSPSLAP
jgi:Ca-activated chloride channel family protein